MKKVIALALVLVMLFAAMPAAFAAPKAQTVKLAHVASEESALNQALLKFAELVSEKTDGGLNVEIYAGGILGTEPELKEMVSNGTVEMVSMGWSLLTNKLSYSIAYFGYYQMLDRDELNAFYDGEIAHKFYDAYEKATGVRVIDHSFYQAQRNVMTTKPVSNLEELKGLVMRTPSGVAVDLDAWASWGANPVGMAMSEVFTALEQGTVEGLECPCSYMYTYSFADAGAKYLEISGHQIYNNLIGANGKWFDSLSEEYQNAILEAAVEAGAICEELEKEQEQVYIDGMVEQGVEIIEWSDEFKEQLKELVSPVYAEQQVKALEEADAILNA